MLCKYKPNGIDAKAAFAAVCGRTEIIMYEDYVSAGAKELCGKTDSETIQNAIRTAVESGVRTVVIPRFCARTGLEYWEIDKAILLPSDITVILDNCRLRLKDGIYDNVFRNENMFTEISNKADGKQHNIRIIGIGKAVLDGGLKNDLWEWNSGKDGMPDIRMNNLIFFHNLTEYELTGFSCINMRHWAINQLYCSNGRVSNIHFDLETYNNNQDGVNVRCGCHNIIIENITGLTGDDVVALTAFPCGGEKKYAVEGETPDIHHITIRNVLAHTRQTIVALRNCDGAKLHHVYIENISEAEGSLGPWGVLRIGENNYYKKRPSIPGETYNIHARGIFSLTRGTVYLGGALSDSTVCDVYAGGDTMHAVTSFYEEFTAEWANNAQGYAGVSMKNVLFQNIHYDGAAKYDETLVGFPGDTGCALDFRCMREEHTLENVIFRDIFTRENAPVCLCKDGLTLDIRK